MFSKNCENYSDFDFGGFLLLAFPFSSPDFPAPKLIDNREKKFFKFYREDKSFFNGEN